MKVIFSTIFLLTSLHVFSYVPTVESLFRHGGNPEVASNAVVLNIKVSTEKKEENIGKVESFFKLYLSKSGTDAIKISQARYDSMGFIENEINHKYYNPNFSGTFLNGENPNVERGLFWTSLRSIFF